MAVTTDQRNRDPADTSVKCLGDCDMPRELMSSETARTKTQISHVPPHSRPFHVALLIKKHVLGHFHKLHKDLRSSPPGFFFQTDQGNPYCNVLCMAGPLKAAKPDGQWGTPPMEDWQSSPSVLLETKLFLCSSDLTSPLF